jgi:hypothetical protein
MAQVKKVRKDEHVTENPKVNPGPNSNQLKDPDEWVTGHEPKHCPNKRTILMPLTLTVRRPKRQSASTT